MVITFHSGKNQQNSGANLSKVEILFVEGDAGGQIGMFSNGIILVEGNALVNVGNWNKGILIVKGNVHNNLGYHNEGLVIVLGNAEKSAAVFNRGNVIVLGKVKSLGAKNLGKIYAGAVEKDMGQPWTELTKEQREEIDEIILEIFKVAGTAEEGGNGKLLKFVEGKITKIKSLLGIE